MSGEPKNHFDVTVGNHPIRIRSNECFRAEIDAGSYDLRFTRTGFYRLYMLGIWYRSIGSVTPLPPADAPFPRPEGRPTYSGPSPRAVLRPLKQPLYDTIRFDALCFNGKWDLFSRPIGQSGYSGWSQTEVETNMTQAAQLGPPEEFDLWGFRAEMESHMSLRDRRRFLEHCVWRFWFGDRVWYSGPLTMIPCAGVTAPTALQASRLPLAGQPKGERAGARRIRGGGEDA